MNTKTIITENAMTSEWRRVAMKDFTDVLESLTEDKTVRILSHLLRKMNKYNKISITQDEVVEELKMSKATVNKAFKKMKEKGLIKKVKRDYYINTEIVSVKGSAYFNKKLTDKLDFKTVEEIKIDKAIEESKNKEVETFNVDTEIKLLEKQLAELKSFKNRKEEN